MFARTASKKIGTGDLFAAWELELARAVAARFYKGYRVLRRTYGVEDLVQEVLVQWFKVRGQHCEERGASAQTYMAVIAERRILELLRAQRADKRVVNSSAASLSSPIGDDPDGGTLADVVADPESLGDRNELLALRIALDSVRPELTERQGRILDRLLDGCPRSDLADELKIHRSTLYADLDRIRKVFQDHGLREFIE